MRSNGPQPFGPDDVAARQITASAPFRTRAELHQFFGEPILSSERRRIEAFELSGEQIVRIGFPVALGKERIRYRGYTLAAYDAGQSVVAVDSGFSGAGYYSDISLAAGDYRLNYRPARGLRVSVTQERFLSDRRIHPPAMGCTLLVACDPDPVETPGQQVDGRGSHGEDSGGPACWRMARIDGGDPQPMIWPRAETFDDNGQVAVHDYFVPVTVAAGQHAIEFSSPELISSEGTLGRLEGASLRAELSCHDGALLYVVLAGRQTESYSAAKRLVRKFKWGYASGHVEVVRDAPSQLKQLTVLLFDFDKWLLPEDDQRD